MLIQLAAFGAVVCFAVAPRTLVPVVKALVLLYGLGLGPAS